jgi:transposase
MDKLIMVGCDLHDKSMLNKMDIADKVVKREWDNTPPGRQAMIADLKRRATDIGAGRIVFAYEASGLGFILHDELVAAGIECHVLAPTGMERSPKHWRRKTDERDAQKVLDLLRAHLLAGNELPSIWIPDKRTRDERELARGRLDLSDKLTQVKTQVRCLLKRNGVELQEAPVQSWTPRYMLWLKLLLGQRVGPGASAALGTLVGQIEFLEREIARLDEELAQLSQTPRYAGVVAAMRRDKGIGVLTAMVFATEMGDLGRFQNRRQVGAFLGLAPSSHESGQDNDHKGHITRQGPARVRKVLNQAVWSRIRCVPTEREFYDRLAKKNPKHKKIAVVAAMRRMAIRCWHNALEAQQAGRARPQAPQPSARPPGATATTEKAVVQERRSRFREFFRADQAQAS